MIKSNLRKTYLARQRSLNKSERIEKSIAIKDRFFSHFNLKDVQTIHFFLSIEKNNEVDISCIGRDLWLKSWEKKTCVPRINFEAGIIESVEYGQKSKIMPNRWGISEPFTGEIIDDKEIDLVLVPLLCFDEMGYRVGYGKGYYDKFLANCRKDCLKVGVSFFEPIGEIEDVREFDVRLDYCVTPEKVWRFD